MVRAFMIGLLPDGEALYTDSAKPLEDQKADAVDWLEWHHDLISVHAVVGGEISDITAAYCRMWVNKADLSLYDAESNFPPVVRQWVPELVAEVLSDRKADEVAARELASDYFASVI